MSIDGRNMYVFRDGRREAPGPELVRALAAGLGELALSKSARISDVRSRDFLIGLLLRSGELECALTDAASRYAGRMARLTDLLAKLLVGAPCSFPSSEELLALLPAEVPNRLFLSPPEGFAFYALHPLDFAELAANAPLLSAYAAVVGIRSIGTTLSAVVRAALIRRGLHAERITVRPTGHPYERHTQFDERQLRWIAEQRANEAEFLVVDEGPGMSGSSFLSVGDALLSAGAARAHLRFLCSRVPDVDALCVRGAATRWNSYQASYVLPATHLPEQARIYIGGGYWRHELMGRDSTQWPASWSQMERLKFLSPDRRTLFKFEGLGRFGAEIRERNRVLSGAGYVPPHAASWDGFGSYPIVEGEVLTPARLSRDVLERMAAYCAFRTSALRTSEEQTSDQMGTMLRFNLAEELGIELNGSMGPLYSEKPVLVDGRMLPHEWVRTPDGRLMKCDATSHCDDHFFPGPATDICWDLAGAIIEWNLSPEASDFFLDRYEALSGDRPRLRLPAFLLAYTVFRMAYCKMAASAMRKSEEEGRLEKAYFGYRQRTERLLARAG